MKDKVTRDLLRMCQNFRRLRRERGISLEELSKNTLVEECLLQCLEADDVPDAFDVEQFCRIFPNPALGSLSGAEGSKK